MRTGTSLIQVNYRENDYVSSILFAIIITILLVIVSDSLLFNNITFYEDRVVKEWFFVGSITIYYMRAKVIGPPSGFTWLSSAHQIRKTDENGKSLLRQIPIFYISFFFRKKDTNIIADILNYLTDDEHNNPRVFKKTILQSVAAPR